MEKEENWKKKADIKTVSITCDANYNIVTMLYKLSFFQSKLLVGEEILTIK